MNNIYSYALLFDVIITFIPKYKVIFVSIK